MVWVRATHFCSFYPSPQHSLHPSDTPSMDQTFRIRTLIDYFEFSPDLILSMLDIGELAVVSDVMDERN